KKNGPTPGRPFRRVRCADRSPTLIMTSVRTADPTKLRPDGRGYVFVTPGRGPEPRGYEDVTPATRRSACGGVGLAQQGEQQGRRVDRRAAGELRDLEPAREPRGGHDVVRTGGAEGREEALLADEARDVVMLHLVPERAGHAATPRVEVDDCGAGDAA